MATGYSSSATGSSSLLHPEVAKPPGLAAAARTPRRRGRRRSCCRCCCLDGSSARRRTAFLFVSLVATSVALGPSPTPVTTLRGLRPARQPPRFPVFGRALSLLRLLFAPRFTLPPFSPRSHGPNSGDHPPGQHSGRQVAEKEIAAT